MTCCSIAIFGAMKIDTGRAWDGARHSWVTPAFDGPPTGGTLYTASLVTTLKERGVECVRLDVSDALGALAHGGTGTYWIDSLYLDSVPRLADANVARRPLWLVAHYLPCLVAHGDAVDAAQLSAAERAALARVDGLLATSAYMARVLQRLGVTCPVVVVEPGTIAEPAQATLSDSPRGLLLANVTEGKGVLPLLEAIAAGISSVDRFELTIVGSVDREPIYAGACRALIDREPALARRVQFAGALAHVDALHRLARSDLLVSASRMESYGMALAEARAACVPVLACAGGNAMAHVVANAGGELVGDPRELAARFIALVREPAELLRRKQFALAHRAVRSWEEAAADFMRAHAFLQR